VRAEGAHQETDLILRSSLVTACVLALLFAATENNLVQLAVLLPVLSCLGIAHYLLIRRSGLIRRYLLLAALTCSTVLLAGGLTGLRAMFVAFSALLAITWVGLSIACVGSEDIQLDLWLLLTLAYIHIVLGAGLAIA
jgi:hypothetical protein